MKIDYFYTTAIKNTLSTYFTLHILDSYQVICPNFIGEQSIGFEANGVAHLEVSGVTCNSAHKLSPMDF